jgi:2-oxoglutarate dehydrogenase E1 component
MSSQENNIIFQKTSFLSGTNSSYIEKLYAKYVENPASIPDSWRQFFEGLGDQKDNIMENQGPSWAPSNIKYISNGDLDIYEKYLPKNLNENSIKEKIVEKNKNLSNNERVDVERSTIDSIRAIMMIRAYRIRGHLIADLDPLQLQEKHHHTELNPETYGFKKEDRNRKIFLDKVLGFEYATVNEILEILLKTYCSKIGIEFMHMSDPEEKSWIQERIEGKGKEANFTSEGKKAIFKKLVEAEGFENYCHTKFVGTKRFGLDGCESLIPALEQIIKVGGNLGVKEVKIGMPHRGIGRKYGRNYFGRSKRPRIQKMIKRAEDFYDKYGWTAVVLARFYPWIRTFMPPIAGLGKMNYYKFLSANIFGAVLWGVGITTLGFYAASIPALDGSSKQIAGFFIVLTIAITLKNYIKAKRS